MCSPKKHVASLEEGNQDVLVLNICHCYVDGSNDTNDVNDSENIFDSDCESLVNETGSCSDEVSLCQWQQNLFDEDDSIYRTEMPNSFYDLNNDNDTSIVVPSPKYRKSHGRNLTLINFDSLLDTGAADEANTNKTVLDKSRTKVQFWLNQSSSPLSRNKSRNVKIETDIENLFDHSHIPRETDAEHQNDQDKHNIPKHAGHQLNELETSGSKRKRIVSHDDYEHRNAKRSKKEGWFNYLPDWLTNFFS